MTEKYKYRFTLHFQTPQLNKVSKFMQSCDLPISFCMEHEVVFTSTTNWVIGEFKEKLKVIFENEDWNLIHIEGGKVE